MIRVLVQIGVRTFSFIHNVQTGCWANTKPSIQWVPGLLDPRAKQPGREVNQLLLPSAEVKSEWRYNSAPLCAFLTWTGTLSSCTGYTELFSMSGPRMTGS